MGRRSSAGGAPLKARRRKAVTPKRRNTPKARHRSSSAAGLSEQVALFKRERDEALARQAATADILRAISQSPADMRPIFDSIVYTAVRLLHCDLVVLLLCDGAIIMHAAAASPGGPLADLPMSFPLDPGANFPSRAIIEKTMLHLPDWSRIELPRHEQEIHRIFGAKSTLYLPLLRGGECIGLLTLVGRRPNMFGGSEIAQAESFRDQALIAITNTRLLNELRQRTENLSESLEQQTATAEILSVISKSVSDTQPVFEAIVQSGVRLFSGAAITITLVDGDEVKAVAIAEADPARAEAWRRRFPVPLTRDYINSTAIIERRLLDIPDVEYAPSDMGVGKKNFLESGYRAVTIMPMIRGDTAIGGLSVVRREPGALSDRQLAVLKTFAAQAVIAIENTRLLTELRQSLDQQIATADVLRVISSSTGDLQPVFDATLANATRLCEASYGTLWLHEGDGRMHAAALYGNLPEAFLKTWGVGTIFRPKPSVPSARAMSSRKPVQLVDLKEDQSYLDDDPLALAAVDVAGIRSIISVPMVKDDVAIGAMTIYRREVRPFAEKQVELVGNFAAQAVIAIENARLLSQLHESLQQQTATADVLKVISRSTFDLQTVLDTLTESASILCAADMGAITREDGSGFRHVTNYKFPPDWIEFTKTFHMRPGRGSVVGRSLMEGKVVQVPDVLNDPQYTYHAPALKAGYRTFLAAPMIREGKPVGVLTLGRKAVAPFSDKQIELISTFADQAAIAIENMRLFEAEQQRTRELAKSLEDLRTAQDRLVQTEKLASLGQLTAGIAHEIKNPLNFVNSFSGVSVELIDELQGALKTGKFDDRARADMADLAETLRGNLEKIEQHGKRADSIVKNMLLHSREGSGEHRPVDINALVEESLNLAYHGARAEKEGFNIMLERSFDPTAGEVDLFPQEITRVLLNLISNGFYAATKRKGLANDNAYEPILSATTKNLGDRVEIRVRDNGTGIPPDVKNKLFNPFFTTKPAGEGTGLGLSISHDIIVKQHAGSIVVDTEPGKFTEFTIVLPRIAASIAKSGGQA